MKTRNILLSAWLLISICACEHKVYMETTVQEDGSLTKSITLETTDTTKNFLGIGKSTGWESTTHLLVDSTKDNQNEKKWRQKFDKTFSSAAEVTNEMAQPSDSLFRVSSSFQKSFKWFYTYLNFSETYHAINRMNYPTEDYFTVEDFSFIDRLPSEGALISKADSLYLARLQEKIFDIYGMQAIFESYYKINEQLIRESGLEERWLDTLKHHKQNLFAKVKADKDLPDGFVYNSMDSIGIPFPFDKMNARYQQLYRLEEAKTSFINHASEGKYTHVINLPWTVINTNADSIAGNRLQWNPPSIKFLLKDYTMHATARKMNYWAVAVSIIAILFTVYLFSKRKP